MAAKKRSGKHGANKKQEKPTFSQDDVTQARQSLEQYHTVVQNLYRSVSQDEAEEALAPLTALLPGTQMALVKELAAKQEEEAADLLTALHTFSPIKEVRKEARRALLRLEEARVYPGWEPPVEAPITAAPYEEELPPLPENVRFWQAWMTDTRNSSHELSLAMCWEEGENYENARMVGFLLDYLEGGVKDIFAEAGSKRRVTRRIEEMRAGMTAMGMPVVQISREQAIPLLTSAVAVNQLHGFIPAWDAKSYRSQLAQLLPEVFEGLPAIFPASARGLFNRPPELSAPPEQIEDENVDETPTDVIEAFLECWHNQDFFAACDLLAMDSPLRERLGYDEWVARREDWVKRAQPERCEFLFGQGYIPEDDEVMTDLLPPELHCSSDQLEVFWALDVNEDSLRDKPPELPVMTLSYPGTRRHWGWAVYTAVEEHGVWRVMDIIDRGAEALNMSVPQLEERLDALDVDLNAAQQSEASAEIPAAEEQEKDAQALFKELEEEGIDLEDMEGLSSEDLDALLENFSSVTRLCMHYLDALLARQPEQYDHYGLAYTYAVASDDFERAAAYAWLAAQHHPQKGAESLRHLAVALKNLAAEGEDFAGAFADEKNNEQTSRIYDLAQKALRDAIATSDDIPSYVILAQLLFEHYEQENEAEVLLQKAASLAVSAEEQAQVEYALAHFAAERGDLEQALGHYLRTAELNSEQPLLSFEIGRTLHQLERLDEAIEYLQRALEAEPEEEGVYAELVGIHLEREEWDEAREVLQRGLEFNPASVPLRASLSIVYMHNGDLRQAKKLLEEAEGLDSTSETVRFARAVYEEQTRTRTPKVLKWRRKRK